MPHANRPLSLPAPLRADEHVLPWRRVLELVPLSRQTVERLIARGAFPAPVTLFQRGHSFTRDSLRSLMRAWACGRDWNADAPEPVIEDDIQTDADRGFVRSAQVCGLINKSEATRWRMCKEGVLEASYEIARKLVVYRAADIAAMLDHRAPRVGLSSGRVRRTTAVPPMDKERMRGAVAKRLEKLVAKREARNAGDALW